MPLTMDSGVYFPTDTFTCFPRLPLEIRRKIWHAAASFPRIIALNQECSRLFVRKCNKWPVRELRYLIQKTNNCQPATLQVCHEARCEALKIYSLEFGFILGLARHNTTQDPYTYREKNYSKPRCLHKLEYGHSILERDLGQLYGRPLTSMSFGQISSRGCQKRCNSNWQEMECQRLAKNFEPTSLPIPERNHIRFQAQQRDIVKYTRRDPVCGIGSSGGEAML